MDSNYTFSNFEEDLNKGYKIYITYVNNKYLIYKTNTNCYTQELVNYEDKNPQPRMSIITQKRLKELFKFAQEIEYFGMGYLTL